MFTSNTPSQQRRQGHKRGASSSTSGSQPGGAAGPGITIEHVSSSLTHAPSAASSTSSSSSSRAHAQPPASAPAPTSTTTTKTTLTTKRAPRVGAFTRDRPASYGYGAPAPTDESADGSRERIGARGSYSPSPSYREGEWDEGEGSQVKREYQHDDAPSNQGSATTATATARNEAQLGVPSATANYEKRSAQAKARFARYKEQQQQQQQQKGGEEEASSASQKGRAARKGKASAASLGSVRSPDGKRRSTRLSDAGSQAGGDDGHRQTFLSEHSHVPETYPPDTIEEEEADHAEQQEEDEEDDDPEEVKNSQRWDDSLLSPGNASRSRTSGKGVSAFYLRARGSMDDDNEAPSFGTGSSLLRGAQKSASSFLPPAFHQRYERRGGDSGSVSVLGDDDDRRSVSQSYSYAEQEAEVRRMQSVGSPSMDGDATHSHSHSRSERMHDFLNGSASASASNSGGGGMLGSFLSGTKSALGLGRPGQESSFRSAGQTASEQAGDDSVGTLRRASRSRRRKSRPHDEQTYRPSSEEEDDDESEGRKVGHSPAKRRTASGRSATATASGKEAEKVWADGKRKTSWSRRKQRKANGGASAGEEEDSQLSEEDEDAENGDVTANGSVQQASAAEARGKAVPSSKKSRSRPLLHTLANSTWLKRLLGALLALLFALFFASLGPRLQPHSSQVRPWAVSETAPADVQMVVKRLRKLEETVASLGGLTTDVRGLQSELARARQDLSDRLAAVERSSSATAQSIRALESQAQTLRKELDAAVAAAKQREADLMSQLASLQDRLTAGSGSSSGSLSQAELSELRKKVERVERSLSDAQTAVARLTAAQEKSEQRQGELSKKVDLIEKNLPTQLPVSKDAKTGALRIEPAFWLELKKVFAAKGETASSSGQAEVGSADSWTRFKQANEASLRALMRQEVQDSSRALISRDDFSHLLDSELSVIKAQMEKKFNANLDTVKDELWTSIQRTGDAYKASGSLSSGSAQLLKRLSGADSGASANLADGGDGRETVLALIDEALERYSADRIGKQDFALFSAGGRIIPSLTSPDYEIKSPSSWLSKLVPGSGSPSIVKGRSAVMAIHKDSAPGMCWPFAGSDGQLGVALSQPVVVSDLTFEHAPKSLVGDAIASAPREISVWGLMQSSEDVHKFSRYKAERAATNAEPMPMPPSDDNLYLGSYLYDTAGKAVQTYPVPPELSALQIPTSVLRFRVTSNHGNPDFTCVYRVRVHGTPASA